MFKPMLAATLETADYPKLQWPLLASPKLDGVRAIVRNGVLVSRNLKPIPNLHCQELYSHPHFEGLDGELIVGKANAEDCFRVTMSGVMSEEGEPNVKFCVFDCADNPLDSFANRLHRAGSKIAGRPEAAIVAHTVLRGVEELDEYEARVIARGYEGVMLRNPAGYYKYGRGTLKALDLMKLKRFADDEAEVVGFEEQQHNGNEATKDELGRTKRTTHKAGKTGKGTLGALLVRGLTGPYKGVEFSIGSGFTDSVRGLLWDQLQRGLIVGSRVSFKHFPTGSKDAPRFPVFKGFRAEGT